MLRLITQNPTTSTLLSAALALLVVNCSATGDPVTGSYGGTGNSSSGGSSSASGGNNTSGSGTGMYGGYTGSGGSSTGSGGSTTGGATGNGGSSTGSGGSTTTGSGGSTTTGSGGATTTGSGGATTTGSGGAATCATYSGKTLKDSAIFKDGFGTSKSGTTPWSGYAYTYTYGTGVKIDPVEKTGCFKGAQLCANGSVPASYDAGAGIGWNIAQMAGASAKSTVALSGSIKVTAAGATAGMRINLAPPSAGEVFCYTLLAADATSLASGFSIPVKNFKQFCYEETKAVAYAGEMIEAIQIAVPGDKDAGAKAFDVCLVDVEPG